MNYLKIVNLDPEEWQFYKDLRLRALKEEPQAYASTFQENVIHRDSYWKKIIEQSTSANNKWLIFAKTNTTLVGMAGAFTEKNGVNAVVISVYVVPEERGKGIATYLMKELLKKIKMNKHVQTVTVYVNSEQQAAVSLYEKLGFKRMKERRIILGDGVEHIVSILQIPLATI